MKCSLLQIAAASLCVAGVALGQTDLERFNRQLEQIHRDTRLKVDTTIPPGQRMLVDYGGLFTSSFLAIDDVGQNTHLLRQQALDGYALVSLDGAHEFFVRARTSYNDFNTGDAFDAHGDDWTEPTLERGHYSFNLQRYLAAYEGRASKDNLVIRGGRQLVHWANGLTLSRTIDGGTVALTIDKFRMDIVGGTTRPSTTDIDSSRPGFDGDTHREFYGGMLSYAGAKHKPYFYGLAQLDNNGDDILVTGAVRTRFEYDSWYLGCGSAGNFGDRWLYQLEMVYESGEGVSNSFDPVGGAPVMQTEEDISAMAVDLRLDYLLHDANRTRLSAELLLATGDSDRLTTTNTFGGNEPGSSDHAFNAFGLIDAGLAFAPNVSNLIMIRGGASTFPMPAGGLCKRMQVGTNVFVFGKMQADAPIDEETSDSSYLGTEIDLFLNWQITSELSLPIRYGVFFPGQAISADKDPRHFLYAGVAFAF